MIANFQGRRVLNEQVMWGIGIVVAVALAFLAPAAYRRFRSRTQVQKTNFGSASIQSGRDTKINDK